MFCHKCGHKSPEGAAFCQKCGVKLINDDTAQKTFVASAPTVTQKPSGAAPSSSPTTPVVTAPIADSQGGNRSDAVIHSYTGNYKDMAIKIYCNGQYVDSIRKGGTLNIPISTDSLLEFKCAFRKASFSVKKGEYKELKLDFHPSSGKLLVFDMNSGNFAEEQAKLTQSRKRWVKFAVIAIVLGILLSGISYVIRNAEKSAEQDTTDVPAYAEQTDTQVANNNTPTAQGNDNQSSVNSDNSNEGEVLYKGIPLSQFFEMSIDEVVATLGASAYHDDYKIYGDIDFGLLDDEITSGESMNPEKFTVDGATLEKNRAELIALLGNPWHEGESVNGYELMFERGNYMLSIELNDYEGTARQIWFMRNTDDDGSVEYYGDEDFYEYYGDNYSSDDYYDGEFRRTDYFTGISNMDLMRYPDNNLYSKVYFSGYTVNNVIEPRVYLASNGNNYLIIDDRNGIGANAFDNDKVSVYGTFYGNQSVSFTDGRSQQVPHIVVDKLVINTILPQDSADFAQAYVETVNRYSKAWSDENEYLSGTKVKLILSSSNVAGVSDYFMPVEAEVFTNFYVDGYSIPFFNVVIDGEPIGGGWSGSYGKMDKLPIPVENDKLYVVVGDLELLFGMDGSSHARLHFESIEPYE